MPSHTEAERRKRRQEEEERRRRRQKNNTNNNNNENDEDVQAGTGIVASIGSIIRRLRRARDEREAGGAGPGLGAASIRQEAELAKDVARERETDAERAAREKREREARERRAREARPRQGGSSHKPGQNPDKPRGMIMRRKRRNLLGRNR